MSEPEYIMHEKEVDGWCTNAADTLFEVYEEQTDDGETSREGLLMLQGVMDTVPDEYRGVVFERFLMRLEAAGYSWDPELFQPRQVH